MQVDLKLQQLVERINANSELIQLWKCANINAVDRLGMSDHGAVHIRIVANAALRIQRLLIEAEIEPSVVTNYQLTPAEAEVDSRPNVHRTGIKDAIRCALI